MTVAEQEGLVEGDVLLCINSKPKWDGGEKTHLTEDKTYTFVKTYVDTVIISDCDNGPDCRRCRADGWNIDRFVINLSEAEIAKATRFDTDILSRDVSNLNFKVADGA